MRDFLSQPIWGGIQGLCAVIALAITIVQLINQANHHNATTQRTGVQYIRPMSLLMTPLFWGSVAGIFLLLTLRAIWPSTRIGAGYSSDPQVVTLTPNPEMITVINQLVLPIQFHAGIGNTQIISGEATLEIPVTGTVDASYEVVKEHNTDGEPIGDDISETIVQVAAGQTITIDNIIGAQHYFFPIITNTFADDCTVVVNEGLPSENRPSALIAGGRVRVWMGYYRLSNNSNVTLHCNDHYSWIGVYPDQAAGGSIVPYIEPNSGWIEMRFTK
jgi:hypothetical protein